MIIETLTYSPTGGWSAPVMPALDSDRTLVLIFGARRYGDDASPIRELTRAFPNSHVAGCSTAGEISDAELLDESLSVAIIRFDHCDIATAVAQVATADQSFSAGEAIARKLASPSLRGVLVFSDGLRVNGSELVCGLNSALPDSVVVTGGLAADADRFERTWILNDGEPCNGYISAVGLYGDRLRLGHGSQGGWDIFGPERVVTRSDGSVLYELDGKPALELYKEYLGDRAAELPASALLFPLALRTGPADAKRLVRTILAVDEAKQSMTFAGDVPQGSLSQFMRANFDRLIDGAAQSAKLSRRADSVSPCLSIAVSCVGRRLVLGERAEEELEAVLEQLPKGCRQVGFYSYGEISPYSTGRCDFHNQTMTLTTVSEA